MDQIVKKLIRLYQHVFVSNRQMAHCKYVPSCSEYMLLAVERYGALRGVIKGLWRVLRCNPFSKGGLDLP